MVEVDGVWTLQLGTVMVAPGQTADRLSQDQALPASIIRACVEASEAKGRPAPADTYFMIIVLIGIRNHRGDRCRKI